MELVGRPKRSWVLGRHQRRQRGLAPGRGRRCRKSGMGAGPAARRPAQYRWRKHALRVGATLEFCQPGLAASGTLFAVLGVRRVSRVRGGLGLGLGGLLSGSGRRVHRSRPEIRDRATEQRVRSIRSSQREPRSSGRRDAPLQHPGRSCKYRGHEMPLASGYAFHATRITHSLWHLIELLGELPGEPVPIN